MRQYTPQQLADARQRANLLGMVSADVELKPAANGLEWRGACPFCGEGRDRFAVFALDRDGNRPGPESFSTLSILAVVGMLGFAGRDLASRAAPASLGTSVLGLYGFLAVIAAGATFLLWESEVFVRPDLETSLYLLGAILSGVAAYSALMKAMRTGEVSAVTPFRYTRLLFGLFFGVFLFGEQLSFTMFMGCGLIVVSGVFILLGGQGKLKNKFSVAPSREH